MGEKAITREDVQEIVQQSIESAIAVNTEMVVKQAVQEMFEYYNRDQETKLKDNVRKIAEKVTNDINEEMKKLWQVKDKEAQEEKRIRKKMTYSILGF